MDYRRFFEQRPSRLVDSQGTLGYIIGRAKRESVAEALVIAEFRSSSPFDALSCGTKPFLDQVCSRIGTTVSALDSMDIEYGAALANDEKNPGALSNRFIRSARDQIMTEPGFAEVFGLSQKAARNARQNQFLSLAVLIATAGYTLVSKTNPKLETWQAVALGTAILGATTGIPMYARKKESEALEALTDIASPVIIGEWAQAALEHGAWSTGIEDRLWYRQELQSFLSPPKKIEDIDAIPPQEVQALIDGAIDRNRTDDERGFNLTIRSRNPELGGTAMTLCARPVELEDDEPDDDDDHDDRRRRDLEHKMKPEWGALMPIPVQKFLYHRHPAIDV